MKRIFPFVVLLLLKSAFAQERTFPYFETYLVPKDSSTVFYTDFKISYDKLFFEKVNGQYKADCFVGIELFRNDSLFYRKTVRKNVFVGTFEETKNSRKYFHRFFSTELPHGKYFAKFQFQILNVQDSFVRFTKEIESAKADSKILRPIVVKKIREKVYSTISLQTVSPFSASAFDLLIPTTAKDSLCTVKIRQFGETVSVFKTRAIIPGAPTFALIGNEFVFTPKQCAKEFKIFEVKNFSSKLLPGKARIEIIIGENSFTFPLKIIWENEPFSLSAENIRTKALKMLFDEQKIATIEQASENMRMKSLFDLWREFDPDTSNAYNEIMTEFFRRVDYAIEHFSSPQKQNGFETDRGSVYIRYGEPLKKTKDLTSYDYNREIWDYGGSRFIFIDEKGNGDYKLVKKL